MFAWRRDPEDEDAGRPWATWALLVGTLAAQLAAGATPALHARLALAPEDPRLAALLGHLLVHAGFVPLLGTLACIAAAGPWLEARVGKRLLFAGYAAAGLAGAATYVALGAGAEPWLGGASAGAGLLGLLAVASRGVRADLAGVLAGRAGALLAPGWTPAAVWLGVELAGLLGGPPGATARFAAHAAGLGFGALLALVLERSGVLVRPEPAVEDERAPRRTRRASITPRELPRDRAQLEAMLGEADDPAWARAYLAEASGTGAARAVVAQRFAEALEWRRREPAIALWCALVESGPAPAAGTDALLQLGSWLRGAGRAGEATTALYAALAGADGAAAAKIARSARRSDPVICYRAAERALADASIDGSERKALEGLRLEAERDATTRGVILVPEGAEPAPAPLDGPKPAVRTPQPARTDAPVRRALAHGEAIELPPEPDAIPVAPVLPDPASAGDAAFLDAFHAALHEEAPPEEKPEAAPGRRLRVREAAPRALEADALALEIEGRGTIRLRLARLHGVALAGVRGLSERAGDKPVLIVDLLLSPEAEPELHVLRLRSDRFDPRRLVPGETSPLKALRRFVATLAGAAHAPLLPAPDVAGEAPLRIYRSPADYEREVLGAAS